ncbi:MAG: PilZ domain-containing protein [Candidatus Omnitrophica bacterium]|nr:PilZ domain-containing protein [Candidatus Omnitrophota bacterium]
MAKLLERREFTRRKSRFTLRYKDLAKPTEKFRTAISADVSEGGVRFQSEKFIALACHLAVELEIPTMLKPIKVISKIAWVKKLPIGEDYEVGNQFLEISNESKDVIRSFMRGDLRLPASF